MNAAQYIFTAITSTPDSWGSLKIVQGSGELGSWDSFSILAGALLSLGIMIRGAVIFSKAMFSPEPGGAVKGLLNLIGGLVVVAILWALTGAK